MFQRSINVLFPILLFFIFITSAQSENASPHLVKNITPESFVPSPDHHPVGIFPGSQHLYFVPDESNPNDYGVWISDGSEPGTYKVPGGRLCWNITEWSDAHRPREWAVTIGDKLFFSGSTCDIWQTDGTQVGTAKVSSFGQLYLSPDHLTVFGNAILFTVQNSYINNPYYRPYQLWFSDGTPQGTRLVKDLYADMLSDLQVSSIRVVDGKAYFFTYLDTRIESGNWYQLWRSDGTSEGTNIIAEFIEPLGYWTPDLVIGPNHLLFFTAPLNDNNIHQMVVWQTDGTEAGTQPVDVLNNTPSEYYQLYRYQLVGNHLYIMQILQNGFQILTTQGKNSGGIIELANFPFLLLGELKFAWAAFDNRLFFTYYYQIWESEGTAESTKLFYQFEETYPQPQNLYGIGSRLFLAATDVKNGTELWEVKGDNTIPQLLMDINPGPSSSVPSHFAWAGNKLFFYAFDAINGRELWVYDYFTDRLFIPMVMTDHVY